MKKQVILTSLTFLLLFISLQIFAQVGINTDGSQPDPSAMLDVKSAIKGFLPPRVALTSLNVPEPIASPVAIGLLVFNTATAGNEPYRVVPGYYYWNGGKWVAVTTPQGVNPGEMLYWNGSAWVTIPSGTHGQQLYFCNGLPTWGGCYSLVTTAAVTGITQNSAISGGDVTSDGGSSVVERGVCWGTDTKPTIYNNKTIDGSGTGVFTSNVTGLTASTSYYLRAYATNGNGTAYGNEFSFSTSEYSGAPVTTIPVISACPGASIDVPVTVAGFMNVGAITLTIHFNSSVLTYSGATNTSGYPGLSFNGSEPGIVTIDGPATAGITFPDNTVLFTMHFNYSGGSTTISCFDNGESCQYLDGNLFVMNDLPTSSYYINGLVNEDPEVGAPVFEAGPTSARCQGAATVAYQATAANSTGITYSLDALSLSAGNTIETNSGTVSYTASWAGISVITASAAGCNGPKTSDHTVTVNPFLPVSVSVSSSANPACAGTLVTFSAVAVNGGSLPSYQWKVNGSNAGTNSETFSYIPVNGDLVTCKVTSNALCTTGNPAISNAVNMTVNSLLPVSVTIVPSANSVCAGTSVTFSAAAINGGSSPTYQWRVNGVNSGTNSMTYSYSPANNDQVTCILTSNSACATGNPATSNVITMLVNPLLPVSVSITSSFNDICAGISVTYTATPANGGTNPVYQWKVNGINAGTNNSSYSYIPLNNDVVNCLLTSNEACVTSNPAISNAINMVVNQLLPVSISITASNNSVCAGTSVTFTALAINGGVLPTYQWKINGVNAGTNSATYSYTPLNNDLVTCVVISNANCITGNPATSNAIPMIVNPLLSVSVSVVASANPVCAGTAVTYTATAINGGAAIYQWMVNGNNVGTGTATYTYNPANNDVVICKLTSNANCVTGNPATSAAIIMTVNPILPVSILITASANPVCGGTQVTFTAVGVNGGTVPNYQWLVNGINTGTNNTTFAYIPSNNDAVKCVLTSSESCVSGNPASSNEVIMIFNPQLSPGTIGENQTICMNSTPLAIHGLPPLNGTFPVYQWQSSLDNNIFNNIDGATTLDYQPETLNSTTYYRQMQNATGPCGGPLPTNIVTITVNPLVEISVIISADPVGTICNGATVNFSATGVNGGTSPAFQWTVNGTNVGSNSSNYAYIPMNGDMVICLMTSDMLCVTNNPATSNALVMDVNINANLPVGVSIVANPVGSVCAGTSVEFTATSLNGGTSPVYQWKVNGVNAGTNSTVFSYEPINGDVVACVLTSNELCVTGNPATSNNITATVNAKLPVSISIVASANPVCAGNPVTYTATAVNGGTSPVYQWKLNGVDAGTNSATYTYTPVTGDVITCVLTSSETCISGNPATSNVITMTATFNPIATISIVASANPFCSGSTVTYTATITGGGPTPTYQWKVNGSSVGTSSSTLVYNPLNNDVVTCIMTSSLVCVIGSPATSNAITMNANPQLPVSVSIVASANSVCGGSSVTYTATPVNGGTSPVYQWKVNGVNAGTNSSTYTYVPANGNVVTCVVTSNATCISGNPATSNAITMSVNTPTPVSVSISANPAGAVCQSTSVTFTATATNGGSSPSYQWKVNGINVGSNASTYTYTPLTSDMITCVLTSNLTCTSGNPATSNAVMVTVNAIALVSVTIAPSANPVIPGTSVTFTATPVNGGTAPAYQWKVNGTNVGTSSSTYTYTPTHNDNILCVLTSSITTCVSGSPATSNTIIMAVVPGIPCPGFPTVTHGGKTYNTVYIGTQCWLKENLNIGTRIEHTVTQTHNGIIEKYCNTDLESNCDVYGGLYQWGELMQYVTTAGAQGICPTGWHVPTDAEYTTLNTFLGGISISGGKLKETGLTHWLSPNSGATNSVGFTILPSGYYAVTGGFGGLTRYGQYYTSTQYSSTVAWINQASYSAVNVTVLQNYKTTAVAVRCLKN